MFVPILAYHKIQDNFDFSITRISPKEFGRQVRYLAEHGYSCLAIRDYLSGKPLGSKKVVITFDDAYESVFQHALPILAQYNFTASIFTISDYVGRWNDWDYNPFRIRAKHCDWSQLRTLVAEGWEIGSHTATHRMLSTLPTKQIWSELKDSRMKMEDKLACPVHIISYPFGRFDTRVLNLARAAGYLGGCTLGYTLKDRSFGSFVLTRRGVYLREPFKWFEIKLQNNIWSHYDDVKQRAITFCSQASIFLRYLQYRNKNYLD